MSLVSSIFWITAFVDLCCECTSRMATAAAGCHIPPRFWGHFAATRGNSRSPRSFAVLRADSRTADVTYGEPAHTVTVQVAPKYSVGQSWTHGLNVVLSSQDSHLLQCFRGQQSAKAVAGVVPRWAGQKSSRFNVKP